MVAESVVTKLACSNCHNQEANACNSQPQIAPQNSTPKLLMCIATTPQQLTEKNKKSKKVEKSPIGYREANCVVMHLSMQHINPNSAK